MRWVKVIFESESLKSHAFFTSGESPNAPPIINESCEKPAFSASFIITESSSEEICFPSTQRAIFLLFDGRTASIRSPSFLIAASICACDGSSGSFSSRSSVQTSLQYAERRFSYSAAAARS